ncbi:MAG: rRNA pseudouridine synthase [Acidobacteriia bacterium]|nr:rRNA pseudouridine synthase [Terriglobia bacterium]
MPTLGRKKEPRKKTLDRVLSQAGVGSRKEARQWIGAGRVAVDGKKIQTPDAWVDPQHQRVTLDGRPLRAARKIYLLLYKPKGYVTTYKDPDGRPTVYDLLKDVPEKVFSAGRLDLDSSGLLIFTNDGEFADHITSPESHVPKTYLVKASMLLTDDQLDQLRRGVVLTDGLTRPAEVKRIRDSGRYTFFEITITEGRNRQVRRMVETLGAKVLKLVRTGIGSIRIGDLQIGKYRALSDRELRGLA